jgi:hypothetical protein
LSFFKPFTSLFAICFSEWQGLWRMRRICHVEFKPSTLLFAIRFSEWQGLWRMRRIRHA